MKLADTSNIIVKVSTKSNPSYVDVEEKQLSYSWSVNSDLSSLVEPVDSTDPAFFEFTLKDIS